MTLLKTGWQNKKTRITLQIRRYWPISDQPAQPGNNSIISETPAGKTQEKGIRVIGKEEIMKDQRVETSLQEKGKKYREIFENAIEGIYQTTPEGRFLNANPAIAHILGYESPAELMATISDIGKQVHTDSSQLHEIKRLLQKDGVVKDFAAQFIRKDKRKIWVAINANIIIDKVSNRQIYQVFATDITEKKRLENQLLQDKKMETIGTLAGGIAHDFNNLLAAVYGYIEMAKEDLPYGSRAYNYLLNAERSAQQAAELTKRLITFSKGGGPVKSICDISGLLKAAVINEKTTKTVKKNFIVPGDLWLTEVDKEQISQVIQNITVNAVEAMQEDGILTVSAENVTVPFRNHLQLPEGLYIRITINDTGKGISAEDMPLIFDPYYSTKQRGAQKGMGLGLALCYSIISRHKGCITVESKPGRGSTFQIYLPAVIRDKEPGKATIQEIIPGLQKRIMVMDDEEAIRDMTGNLLESLGCQVTIVRDGVQAIDQYKKARAANQSYDLVILDLTIKGGMGGMQTMEELLKIDPQVKAIIFSGFNDDPVIENYSNYGFLAALTKPFTRKEIQAVLEDIFHMNRANDLCI
jgi:PAS domain S-box-containing protein